MTVKVELTFFRLLQLGFFVWAYLAKNQDALFFTGILYIASVIDAKDGQA